MGKSIFSVVFLVCISSALSEDTLRIVDGGRGPYDGRLEVLHSGTWRNICDDGFTRKAVQVACRQLGLFNPLYPENVDLYVSGNNSWFQNNGDYWLDDVKCKGTESRIEDCQASPWGTENCNGAEVVGVKCDGESVLQARLDNESFVEVYYDQQWHGVCPTDYSETMGLVVCGYLGYNLSHVFASELSSNVSNTEALPFGLYCKGNETVLGQCLRPPTNTTCLVDERARISCLNGTVEETVSIDCSGNNFGVSVDLVALRRLFPDFLVSDLVLGGVCTGNLEGDTLTFNQDFNLCSTKSKQVDDDTLMITNTLVYLHVSPEGIIRHFKWAVDLQCLMSRNESTDISYIPVESNHIHHLGNSSRLQVEIKLFSDPLYQTELIDVGSEATVGSEIFVQVKSADVAGLRMIVENCYAKPDQDADKSQSFSLIENGCEVDTETHLTRFTDVETRFFFTAFAFPNGQNIVDVHCDVRYCSTAKGDPTCRHGCHSAPIIGR